MKDESPKETILMLFAFGVLYVLCFWLSIP